MGRVRFLGKPTPRQDCDPNQTAAEQRQGAGFRYRGELDDAGVAAGDLPRSATLLHESNLNVSPIVPHRCSAGAHQSSVRDGTVKSPICEGTDSSLRPCDHREGTRKSKRSAAHRTSIPGDRDSAAGPPSGVARRRTAHKVGSGVKRHSPRSHPPIPASRGRAAAVKPDTASLRQSRT